MSFVYRYWTYVHNIMKDEKKDEVDINFSLDSLS